MKRTLISILITLLTFPIFTQNVELVDFTYSDCDESIDVTRVNTRIVGISYVNDTLQIEVGTVALCCVDFIPSISFRNDTLNLLFEETGIPCECECCYQFVYSISGLNNKLIEVELQSKHIELSSDKYYTYPLQYFTYNNDTIGFKDKYGLKQGVFIFKEDEENILQIHYTDDIPTKYVRTSKGGEILKEGTDMFDVFYAIE